MEKAKPLTDPLTQHVSHPATTPVADTQALAKPAEVTPNTQAALTETSSQVKATTKSTPSSHSLTQQATDELTSPNIPKMEAETVNGANGKEDMKMCQSGNPRTWEGKRPAEHQEHDSNSNQPLVSTATKDTNRDKGSHRNYREFKNRSRERCGHWLERENYPHTEHSRSRYSDRHVNNRRDHNYNRGREECSHDWQRDRKPQTSHRFSSHNYKELAWCHARRDSRNRWNYSGEQSSNRAKLSSPRSASPSPQPRTRKRSLSGDDSTSEERRVKKYKKSKKKNKDKHR